MIFIKWLNQDNNNLRHTKAGASKTIGYDQRSDGQTTKKLIF
jgi:hypothetical protein